jgi:hypothetical protein
MNVVVRRLVWIGVAALGALLAACARNDGPAFETSATAPAASQPFKPNAGIQDIMGQMVAPAAELVWDSVSTTVTASGTVEKRPQTDEEWSEVRRQALLLAEASNLMMIDGRRVTRDGGELKHHGTPGNLTAEQVEHAIAADRGRFVQFAQELHGAGEAMLAAADARNPQGLIDAGDSLYQACEGCHLKFWYPGQKIPVFPDQAPDVDSASSSLARAD